MKPSIGLGITIDHKGWQKIPGLRGRLNKAAIATFEHLPKSYQVPAMIGLLLTGNAAIRRLNRDFRGMDKPTNVLSFPQFDQRKLPKKGKIKDPIYLGDIAIGYQYIVAETKANHKILKNHAIHLLIHGILHLFGYDHHSDKGAARMERLESRIMANLGLPDPYTRPVITARKK